MHICSLIEPNWLSLFCGMRVETEKWQQNKQWFITKSRDLAIWTKIPFSKCSDHYFSSLLDIQVDIYANQSVKSWHSINLVFIVVGGKFNKIQNILNTTFFSLTHKSFYDAVQFMWIILKVYKLKFRMTGIYVNTNVELFGL